MTRTEQIASPTYPPEKVEGWYTLHQLFRIDQAAMRARRPAERAAQEAGAARAFEELATPADGAGWSTLVDVTGLVIYFSVASLILRGTLL